MYVDEKYLVILVLFFCIWKIVGRFVRCFYGKFFYERCIKLLGFDIRVLMIIMIIGWLL